MNGRSIRIFLVDGDAGGLLTAEVMNWSGKMIVAPRTKLSDLAGRAEAKRTGVYVLAGPDPENPSRDVVYIGEGDNVFKRLAAHDKDASKEFWVRCVSIISKDLNLTKAHVRYLESRLIELGVASGRAKIHNGTAPPLPPMPESDIADMEGFLEQVELVLPVLGFSFLQRRPDPATSTVDRSPVFSFSSREASATAQEIDGEFVVLAGATARREGRPSWDTYVSLRDSLVAEGKLVETDNADLFRFAEDVSFSSPSAAAAVVAAGNMNGRTAWKLESGETYQAWHESRLPPDEAGSDGD